MAKNKTAEPVISTASKVSDHPKYVPERDRPMSIKGDFSVAVVGDIVQTRPITQLDDAAVAAALQPVRDADFAVGNLEQAIGDWRQFEGHQYGVGAFLIMADPAIADDLGNMGFDILSRANNRLSDFGAEGNRETDWHLRRAGIQPVGFGEHLSEARAPVYADTPKGRIAAVAATSSLQPGGEKAFSAAARIGNANGRPGVNSLHVSRTITLPPKAWQSLNELVHEASFAFPLNYAIQGGVTVFEDRIVIQNNTYVPGEKAGYSYTADQQEVDILMKEIRNAAAYSNFTVFTLHSHQWNIDPNNPVGGFHGETNEPPDFLQKLGRAAIDNGADMFCVHGPFELRAIEIYQGKPIFYGLGSFIRQPYMQEVVPWETYSAHTFVGRRYDSVNPLDTNVEDAEFLTVRTGRHPARYFKGASFECSYKDARLRSIRIHPVDLGFDGPLSDLGIPKQADGEGADDILQSLARHSATYGTNVEIVDGVGIIDLQDQEK
jgi:poly-gamma-glutamate capsule biosynthesis protein CapA/YwtB (metallophosphatase superfamily)